MNYISDVIIVILLVAFLLITVAIISYKLGKKEKSKIIITERDRIRENISESNSKQVESPKNKEETEEKIKTDTDDEPAENRLIKENMVPLKELYSKKIEEEMNNKELRDVSESEKLSDIKFLKYTSNGYKPAKGDKESRVVRWR